MERTLGLSGGLKHEPVRVARVRRAHLRELMHLPAPVSESDLEGLSHATQRCRQLVGNLQKVSIADVLLEKLPEEMFTEVAEFVSRKTGKTPSQVGDSDFLGFMDGFIHIQSTKSSNSLARSMKTPQKLDDDRRCYICQSPYHLKRDCPVNLDQCFACRSPSHSQKKCFVDCSVPRDTSCPFSRQSISQVSGKKVKKRTKRRHRYCDITTCRAKGDREREVNDTA